MNSAVSFLKKQVKTNPIVFVGLVSLALCTLFTQSQWDFFTPMAPYVLGVCGFTILMFTLPDQTKTLWGLLTVVAGGCLVLLLYNQPHPAVSLLLMGGACLLMLLLYWWRTGQLTCSKAILLLMAMGFLLRLCYVLYTPVYMRQHDVFYFTQGDFTQFTHQRHSEYIEYIAKYLSLPAVDPTQVGLSQLYHPPLHHLIAGLWLRLNVELGFDYATGCENIQLLTLFYSATCMVISYRILRLIGCKSWGLVIPMAILCFHPTFIMMAGSVNNDLLSITLALYAVYATLRWVKDRTMYNMVCIALGVGLSMMTKLSGGLVAPGIALVFLWQWIKAIGEKQGEGRKLFLQFVVFAILCVPLGLWWPIKNAITYQIPVTYVPALGENSGQYLGAYSVIQRLFGVEPDSFSRIFMAWNHSGYTEYNEYNLFLSLLKTSVFGEFTLFDVVHNPTDWLHIWGTWVSKILFFANAGLVGISLIATGFVTYKHRRKPWVWLLLTVWATVLFSYIQFCFAFPQSCTGNFRYAVPTLLCGCCYIGVFLNDCSHKVKIAVAAVTLIFCMASAGCTALLGLV